MALLPSSSPEVVPFLLKKYMQIYSLPIENDATTPDEIVTIGTGICRDSTDIYDMVNEASISVDNTVSGKNGLDTGSVAASKLYYVHLISDPVEGKIAAGLLSLSLASPVLPVGYNAFRHVGYAFTDATSDFLLMDNSGDQNARVFKYDAPIISPVSAGSSSSYAAVALTELVPPVEDLQVSVAYRYTNNAASDVFAMTPGNNTGDAVRVIGQVAGVVMEDNVEVLSKVTSSVPEIDYKVSAGTVAIYVAGFSYYL